MNRKKLVSILRFITYLHTWLRGRYSIKSGSWSRNNKSKPSTSPWHWDESDIFKQNLVVDDSSCYTKQNDILRNYNRSSLVHSNNDLSSFEIISVQITISVSKYATRTYEPKQNKSLFITYVIGDHWSHNYASSCYIYNMSTNHMLILFIVSKYEIPPKMIIPKPKVLILISILFLIIAKYGRTSNRNNKIEILKKRIKEKRIYRR